MRWNSADTGRTPSAGRNPRGYGLPSLVIVMFFVSVLVSTIIHEMVRADEEARAEANFNVARDQMQAYGMTDVPAESLSSYLPHMIPPPGGVLETGTDGDGEWIRFMTGTLDNRPRALYNDRMRGYLGRVSGDGNVTGLRAMHRGDIPRPHPDRVLRSGDRMATDLDMNDQDVRAIGQLTTGVGEADSLDTNLTTGVTTTLITARRGDMNRTDSRTVVTDRAQATLLRGIDNSTRSLVSLVTPEIEAEDVTVDLDMSADDLALSTTEVRSVCLVNGTEEACATPRLGTFLPDDFDEIDEPDFGTLNLDGLRTEDLTTQDMQAEETFGND